jgi:parallel beta-helix repeat protein
LVIFALALSAAPIVYPAPIVHALTRAAPTAGSFIVNSLLDTNSADSVLTLREAILVANGTLNSGLTAGEQAQLGGCTFSGGAIIGGCGAGLNDTIAFSVVGTINLSSALPDINDTAALEITGPAFGLNSITLNGSALGIGVTLLNVTSHGNTLQQLNFADSHGYGVRIAGSNNLILSNHFYGNDDHALVLDGGSLNQAAFNVFGLAPFATPPVACITAERNGAANILLWNGTVQNTVNNNYLTCSLGDGLLLRGAATANNTVSNNLVGGIVYAWGNNGSGVYISHSSHDNLIIFNNIGRNQISGVTLAGAGTNNNTVQENAIGLMPSGEVMGNLTSGVELFAGASNNKIFTNTIAYNSVYGVHLADTNTRFNAVRANTVISNAYGGVRLENGPQYNVIGMPIGGSRAQGNRISGNAGDGLRLVDANTAYNWVLGNVIGLNDSQTAAQPNTGAGIVLDGAESNIIGITPADGNVISGNAQDGLALIGNAAYNSVQGNSIGVNFLNSRLLPNGWSGVALMLGAHDNTIGGGTGSNNNLISHSAQYGVYIGGSGTTTNTVSNNNIYGSGYDGVTIQNGASANTIGGSLGNNRNYIAEGAGSGISIMNSPNNRILGNDVWNNTYYGLVLEGANTTFTYVAGTALFDNGADGLIERNDAGFNIWTALSTLNNGGLGIDKQAPGDPAGVPHPPIAKITSSSSAGGLTTVNGTGLNGTLVEVYGVAPDPSGFGEGKTYLGQALVSGGQWSLTFGSSAASCFTVLESGLLASSEFGPNSCRTFLPLALR